MLRTFFTFTLNYYLLPKNAPLPPPIPTIKKYGKGMFCVGFKGVERVVNRYLRRFEGLEPISNEKGVIK